MEGFNKKEKKTRGHGKQHGDGWEERGMLPRDMEEDTEGR